MQKQRRLPALALYFRLGQILLLGVAALIAARGEAQAHAILLDTAPASGTAIAQSPAEIRLHFNEPILPVSLRVLGLDGKDAAPPESMQALDGDLFMALTTALPDGGYIVSYRVVSADTHPVGGAFVFSVGSAPPPALASAGESGTEAAWRYAKVGLRLVQNVALMLAAGGALFLALVRRPGDYLPASFLPSIRYSAVVASLAAVLGIGAQGGLLQIAPVTGLVDPVLWRLGALTTLGQSTLLLLPALAVAALASGGILASENTQSRRRRQIWRGVTVAAAVLAAASLALTGHSAAAAWWAGAAMAAHAAVVAFWLGALWPLYATLRDRPAAEAAAVVRRFGALALPSVLILLIAGGAVALSRIDSVSALAETLYGRLLVLKVALVLGMLALAAVNRRQLTPALAGGVSENETASPSQRLARNIRLEILLGGAILIATAVLAHTPPKMLVGQDMHAMHAQDGAAGKVLTAEGAKFDVRIEVSPGRPGANDIEIRLTQEDGAALDALEVTLALSLPDAGVEPMLHKAERLAAGHYLLRAFPLPLAGRWRLSADVLINDFEKEVLELEVHIH